MLLVDDNHTYDIKEITKILGKDNFLENYNKKQIPREESVRKVLQDIKYAITLDGLNQYKMRQVAIKSSGFVIVTRELVNALTLFLTKKSGKPAEQINILSVACGLGCLESALISKGFNVICTDNKSWFEGRSNIPTFKEENSWVDIEEINMLKAFEKYGKDMDYVLLSWPYMDNNATELLYLMNDINPNCYMIYEGESYGGCTANDEFFDNIYVEDEMVGVNEHLLNWYGIYDEFLLVRKCPKDNIDIEDAFDEYRS